MKYFMIVPNACGHDGHLLRNNAGAICCPHRAERLPAGGEEPKYSDPEVQKLALNPTWLWLFERGKEA